MNIDKKFIGIVVLLSVLIIALLITGSILIGLGHKNFVVYSELMSWAKLNNLDFAETLKIYNANVTSSNEWTKASIDMFAPGLTFFILSIILIALTTWYGINHKKSNKKF
ncbi:hypothetical protein [Malacoplasma iowae]|nr:hypothetical protein QX179_04130 [Malacoplasma iowae]